jgi:hypothetical protein
MTSQTLIAKPLDQMSLSQSGPDSPDLVDSRVFKSVKTLYCSNHQEEFLDLSAEVESLLEELRTLQPAQ